MTTLSELNLSDAELVAQFMTIFGQEIPKTMGFPSPEVIELRMKLIDEEVAEFKEAVADGDFVNAMKELADCIYVVQGAALAMGVNLDPVFREVHASNLSKLGPDGEVLRRPDGKVMKGPNYRTADVESVLAAMRGY
jgi:predicted HAD superfamily Cof-like phosphohydrolase